MASNLTRRAVRLVRRLMESCNGQDLLEYGLLVSLIAVMAVVVVTRLGLKIHDVLWTTIVNNF